MPSRVSRFAVKYLLEPCVLAWAALITPNTNRNSYFVFVTLDVSPVLIAAIQWMPKQDNYKRYGKYITNLHLHRHVSCYTATGAVCRVFSCSVKCCAKMLRSSHTLCICAFYVSPRQHVCNNNNNMKKKKAFIIKVSIASCYNTKYRESWNIKIHNIKTTHMKLV